LNNILYTIGHSTHSIEFFIELLKAHNIQAIADVRSSPFSKFNPQFNRENLMKSLSDENISYIFLGKELGARRDENECYDDDKVNYTTISKTPAFLEGAKRLKLGVSKMRVALMCAEKDPLTCHRSILISRFTSSLFKCIHILEDGTTEDGESAESRLLKETKLDDGDLFATLEDRLSQAYQKRESKIAYTEKSSSDE
jgi:uncharacterized protein (DUF488 family)